MHTLKRRLDRLEPQKPGRLIVVRVSSETPDEDAAAALGSEGVEATPADLVVRLCMFRGGEAPSLHYVMPMVR